MSSNNVVIVTLFYKNYNYGGVLQAYALCKYIHNLGYKCDVMQLDRFAEENTKKSLITILKEKCKEILGIHVTNDDRKILGILGEKRRLYDAFIETYIPKTDKVFTHSNIEESLPLYDTFICGSDQVWSPVSGRDETFLKFVPDYKKKIAYAASIGADTVTPDFLQYMTPLISRMDAISVREKGAKEIVDSFLDKKSCECLPDPTLLLHDEEWSTISVELPELRNKKFVLMYFIGEDSENWEKGYEIAKRTELTIVNIPYNKMIFNARDYEHREISNYNVGPGEFIWLIKNAECIFTDSFHGTVFSTIFHKKYNIFSRSNENANGSMNGRLSSLLEMLHLPNDATDNEVNYLEMEAILEKERERAHQFLVDALEK